MLGAGSAPETVVLFSCCCHGITCQDGTGQGQWGTVEEKSQEQQICSPWAGLACATAGRPPVCISSFLLL